MDYIHTIESMNLYDAGITLSTKPEDQPNYKILNVEALTFWEVGKGDIGIEMIRDGQRTRWRYRGRYLIRYAPQPKPAGEETCIIGPYMLY